MKCTKCGAELSEGVLFCRECGAKVETQKNTVVNVERKFLLMHVFALTVAQI